MHTPTVMESTTAARDALCAVYESLHTSRRLIDLGLFFETTQPLVLVAGPIMNQEWLVAGDGTITVIHYGHVDTYDMDTTRRMGHPNPIGLFLAAAGVADTRGAPRSGTLDTLGLTLRAHPWHLKAASSATLDIVAEPLPQEEARNLLQGFFATWSAGMEDPFFVPMDTPATWSNQEAMSLEATTDLLLTAAGCVEGIYRVEGQEDSKAPLVVDEDGGMCDKLVAISAILALLFPNTSFQGVSWEYNDGASDRASGYCSVPPMVCEIEHQAPNAHEQMAVQHSAAAVVAKAGPEGQAIWAQLLGSVSV